VKKRKLENGGSFASQGLQPQSSFADVLERLKKEEETNATGISDNYCHHLLCLTHTIETEGGADKWARPALPKINPGRDSISK